jgi:Gluconate 2-dehydrogenase subunit 3
MNRRDALSRVALMLGAAISGPTLIACDKSSKDQAATTAISTDDLKALADFKLTDEQRKILAEVAEHIIPKTRTPGAKDAGVPPFIEMMIKDCYKAPEQKSFLEGISALETQKFMTLSPADQVVALTKLETETIAEMEARNVKQVKVGDNEDKEAMDKDAKGVPFWRLAKELTLLGYFTSEVGVNASFDYQPIPGKFEAQKLKPGQKAYAYLTA